MTDRPKQDETPSLDKEPFEEALDAAEVFSELADDEAGASGDEGTGDAFADEFELAAHRPTVVADEDAAPAPEPEVEAAASAEAAPEAVPVEAITEVAPAAQPAPAPARSATGASIGELFRPVVKHSPPSRIRIEADSVGALFRRFIEQE